MRRAELQLVVGAGTGDHARAERPAELHAAEADASCGRLHEHALARRDARAVDQRQVRGVVRDAERDGVGNGMPSGSTCTRPNRRAPASRSHRTELRRRPAGPAQSPEHPARPRARGPRLPRPARTATRLHLIATAADQHVGEVAADRLDLDADLAGPGTRSGSSVGSSWSGSPKARISIACIGAGYPIRRSESSDSGKRRLTPSGIAERVRGGVSMAPGRRLVRARGFGTRGLMHDRLQQLASEPRHVVVICGGAVSGSEAAAYRRGSRHVRDRARTERAPVRQDRGRPAALARQAARQGIRAHRRQPEPPRRVLRAAGPSSASTSRSSRSRRSWGASAVLLANGAWRDRPLPVPGADAYAARGWSTRTRSSTGSTTTKTPATPGPRYEVSDDAIVRRRRPRVGRRGQDRQHRAVSHAHCAQRGIEVSVVEMEHKGISGHAGAASRRSRTRSACEVARCTTGAASRDMPLAFAKPGATPEQIAEDRRRAREDGRHPAREIPRARARLRGAGRADRRGRSHGRAVTSAAAKCATASRSRSPAASTTCAPT